MWPSTPEKKRFSPSADINSSDFRRQGLLPLPAVFVRPGGNRQNWLLRIRPVLRKIEKML